MKKQKPGRQYFVINIDEPYAAAVYDAMKRGEMLKGTWPEGDISFEDWKELTFAEAPSGRRERLKETMFREIKRLAETLPEEARETYLLCVDADELDAGLQELSCDDIKERLSRAKGIAETLRESLTIIRGEKRFGTFLIEEGLVMPEQVVHALDLQKQSTKSIEKIACEQHMLTYEQILDIINAHSEVGRLFGDTARELGYLNSDQVNSLISLQLQDRPPIGEMLIQMGVLDKHALNAALEKFFSQKNQEQQGE